MYGQETMLLTGFFCSMVRGQIKGCCQCYKSVLQIIVTWLSTSFGLTVWPLISSKTSNTRPTQKVAVQANTSRTDKEVNHSGMNEHTTLYLPERMGSSITAVLSGYLYTTHSFANKLS